MKNLTLHTEQISTIIDALNVAKKTTTSDELKKQYISILITIEDQQPAIDESDPQQVWDELKKEVERVTEVWEDKIGRTMDLIDDYQASSKVSYLIDKIIDEVLILYASATLFEEIGSEYTMQEFR